MSSYSNYPEQPGGQPGYSGQPGYGGPPAYGGPPGYPQPYGPGAGQAAQRPGAVTTAAVLGFIVGALATLGGIFLFVGSSFLVGVDDGSGIGDTFAGIFIFIGLLVVAIAVIMIWGSVLALTGRSRVLLIVGASLLTAFGAIGLVGSIGDTSTTTAGGIIGQLVGLIITIVIIVLLSLTPAAQYFAAHRARRGTLIR